MKRAVFTIVAKNYLAHARALMASLQEADPEVLRFVVLVDNPDGCFDPAAEDYTLVYSSDLPVKQAQWFRFKYTVLELSTAYKPYAAQHLFECYQLGSLVYLDPDILVFRSLAPVFEELASHNFVLTPHLTTAITDDRKPSETDILRSGAYNLGFIGLRRSEECDRFLAWWAERLYDKCIVKIDEGLFVDQKWIDLVPGLFAGVSIVRDATWNVAYWNLHGRTISFVDGRYLVDGKPLLFFHFSGYDPSKPDRLSKYSDRFDNSDLGAVAQLLDLYRAQLLAQGVEQVFQWPYTWGRFEDGKPLNDRIRTVLEQAPGMEQNVDDPFSPTGRAAIEKVWNEPHPRLSRLALSLAASRPDVIARYSRGGELDPARYYPWLLTHGVSEFRLTSASVAHLEAEYRRWQSNAGLFERLGSAARRFYFRLSLRRQ